MVGKDLTFAVMIKKFKKIFVGVSKGAKYKHFVFLLFKPLFYLSTLTSQPNFEKWCFCVLPHPTKLQAEILTGKFHS